jgi:hypothetical protein
MTSPSAERKAKDIADEFVRAEFDDDAETAAWLVKKIAAALKEAEEAGYKKAMRKRFWFEPRNTKARLGSLRACLFGT